MTNSNNTKTARRRKNDNTTEKVVEPLDEVLQEQQVAQLRQDAQEQMELIHSIFSRVCEGAMFLCLTLGVASQDVYCWVHVATAIFLHWSAISIARVDSGTNSSEGYAKYMPVIALISLLVAVFGFAEQTPTTTTSSKNPYMAEMEHLHHLGLAGSNVVTMLGALYLKRDNQATNQQIAALENSKYKYKSL